MAAFRDFASTTDPELTVAEMRADKSAAICNCAPNARPDTIEPLSAVTVDVAPASEARDTNERSDAVTVALAFVLEVTVPVDPPDSVRAAVELLTAVTTALGNCDAGLVRSHVPVAVDVASLRHAKTELPVEVAPDRAEHHAVGVAPLDVAACEKKAAAMIPMIMTG
ncbi:hypothetical protein GCM10007304_48720 [Rhodococcoides trifolii]|uniref:Uncharacterized protein n=1 Tax=Rhodococcoides trifolii TaxID=908250 RepID=A0A917G8V8_9NOCA|nr:hypothetical protein GCM10007304_48720 [Rhodococcus trifolii]